MKEPSSKVHGTFTSDCQPTFVVDRRTADDPLCEFDAAPSSVSNITFCGPSLDDCRRQDSAIIKRSQ
jgi:hypothetical protein